MKSSRRCACNLLPGGGAVSSLDSLIIIQRNPDRNRSARPYAALSCCLYFFSLISLTRETLEWEKTSNPRLRYCEIKQDFLLRFYINLKTFIREIVLKHYFNRWQAKSGDLYKFLGRFVHAKESKSWFFFNQKASGWNYLGDRSHDYFYDINTKENFVCDWSIESCTWSGNRECLVNDVFKIYLRKTIIRYWFDGYCILCCQESISVAFLWNDNSISI